MSEQKSDAGITIYIPLALIAAFLIGCLSMALVNVRENIGLITSDDVSASDTAHGGHAVRKSRVYEDGGLKYRMVSASDLGLGGRQESEPAENQEEFSSAESQESEPAGSREDSARQTSASPVSSEPEPAESDPGVHLKLPLDRYVNFIPHKKGLTAYLTFDDGPSENTDEILDILDFYGVKATFFVNYHEDLEAQYKAIVKRGHTIALHTYSHNYSKVYASESAFFGEMDQISDYIYSLTGVRSKIIRFPGGSSNTISRKYNRGIMAVLKKSVIEKGYVYQDWNVDSCDAEAANTPSRKLMANIRQSLKDHKTAVVLMHDAGQKTRTTVDTLPEIIEFFYSKGYALEKMDMNTEQIHHNW